MISNNFAPQWLWTNEKKKNRAHKKIIYSSAKRKLVEIIDNNHYHHHHHHHHRIVLYLRTLFAIINSISSFKCSVDVCVCVRTKPGTSKQTKLIIGRHRTNLIRRSFKWNDWAFWKLFSQSFHFAYCYTIMMHITHSF